jgi:transcriptional regulator with XRE-family HTH domain
MYFSNNLKYLRKKRGNTQEEMANVLGIKRSTYADYENGKTDPTIAFLMKTSEYFGHTPNELLTTDLGIPLFHRQNKEMPNLYADGLRVVTITVNGNKKENIEFVPVQAIAGYAASFNNQAFIEELPRFQLPGLPEGTYRAFEIQGDSMPPIHEGFIVIGKYVERWQDLKNGIRCVLILKNEGVVFKRVVNEVGQNRRLVLVSDNPEFLPYTVPIAEVLEAWEMKAFIGFPDEPKAFNEVVFEKLQSIEEKLAGLITEKN